MTDAEKEVIECIIYSISGIVMFVLLFGPDFIDSIRRKWK